MEARLKEYSSLFSSMIELIPPNYYICKEEDFVQSSKYFHNTKKRKEGSKESLLKAKKIRLDPSQRKTVEELKKEMEEEKMEDESIEGGKDVAQSSLKLNLESIASVPLSELRQRLSDKIKECRMKRNVREGKTRRSKDKESTKKSKKASKEKGASGKKETISQTLKPSKSGTETPTHVMFNKLDFGNPEGPDGPGKRKKRAKKETTRQLLEKAKDREKKLTNISEMDPNRGEELKEKIKWQEALKKAEGKQEKNDPKLLEKTLRKELKKKEASRKKWKARLEKQDELKDKKQEKRQQHIRERIEAKKAKNAGKKKPKGKRKFMT